jgi:hypothetical protein
MLNSCKIGELSDVYYVPEYIGIEEERRLIEEINGSKSTWTQVRWTLWFLLGCLRYNTHCSRRHEKLT